MILFALLLLQAGGVIRGQVLIPSTRAAERIQVLLQRADGPIAGRVFSDSLGNYEFRGLTSGEYEVIVNVEGYEEAHVTAAVAGTGVFATAIVNINLREKEKAIPIRPDGGASADIVDIAELGRKYPKKAVQDFEKAQDEIRKGNSERAADLLAGALKLAPDFYAAHNRLGTLYQKMNRYRDAEAEYRRARNLNPRAADPLLNLGSLFVQEADARTKEGEKVVGKILDDALDILEECLKIKRSAHAYYLLGTAYYKSKFYEEAETNLRRALEFDAHMPAGRLMLANLYIKQQKWQDALSHLDAYLTENPKAADHTQIEDTRAKVARQIK